MGAVRFLEVELDYGCHVGVRFELPDGPAPVVIAGPNGAGKTTLLEGMVRALFGFNRRLAADQELLEARRPWAGERFRGRVVFRAADGARLAVERGRPTTPRESTQRGARETGTANGNRPPHSPRLQWRPPSAILAARLARRKSRGLSRRGSGRR